jgi:hypothetical protein
VVAFASFIGACGQVRHGEASAGQVGVAGGSAPQAGAFAGGAGGAGGAGAAGGRASAGTAGSGITLGGTINLGEAGMPAGGGPVAVPLLDTQQCGNEFVRVDQLPDMPLFMTGVIDGQPTDVQSSMQDASFPTVGVFRFGSRHVEHVSFSFFLTFGSYTSSINVGVVTCGVYGDLFEEMMPGVFSMDVGRFRTTTYSVDGYEGITIGTMHAEWSNDVGEQHVFDATFALQAFMPDSRISD